MQLSRHLLLTCAVAACLISTLVHAADNEAQIRARQALEEKMKQMEADQAATNAAAAKPQPKAAAVKPPAAKPAPPVITAPMQTQPAMRPVAPSTDAADRQKLQEALRQAQSNPPPAVQQPAAPAVTA